MLLKSDIKFITYKCLLSECFLYISRLYKDVLFKMIQNDFPSFNVNIFVFYLDNRYTSS